MVLMAGFELPVAAIRRMIAGAVQVVVQQDRMPDGRRVVTSIVELERSTRGEIGLRPIFVLNEAASAEGKAVRRPGGRDLRLCSRAVCPGASSLPSRANPDIAARRLLAAGRGRQR
jgi:hypothetical protein